MDGSPKILFPYEQAPRHGEVTEIAEGVLWLRLPLPMALDHVNVYVLDDGDGWSVIDTGFDSRVTRDVWETLLSGPLKGKPVNRVVVTHHHPDHIGLAGWFQAKGAELWTTRTAWLYTRMLVLDEQSEPDPVSLDFYRAAGMAEELYAERASSRPLNFCDIVHPLPLGFHRITDGDDIRMGGRNWSVYTGDGHAPEQATFWSKDDNLVLTADQILPGISSNLGVYPAEPNADPVAEWLSSCERFRAMAEGQHLALPGHKLPFSGLEQRLDQLIENHHSALKRLEVFLKTPHTAIECFPNLFKREIRGAEYGLALAETVAHLNHLLRAGLVSREKRKDGAWLWRAVSG